VLNTPTVASRHSIGDPLSLAPVIDRAISSPR
jgi:hypothetical protein